MSDNKDRADQKEDKELNDLLDSALEDFSKVQSPDSKDTAEEAASTTVSQETDEVSSVHETWTKDFIKQATDQFEKNLQNLIQNGAESDLGASFQKMAETVATVITDGESAEGEGVAADFQSAVAQALKDLSATSENLQSDADLAALFAQTSLEDGAGDILPFMQGMMQSLLSKDILYPSLKELVDKYPAWLEEKKETLSSDDTERYTKQLELMQKVCTELEKEKEDDPEPTKKQRFETILSLMQEMQNCGQPPEELVGEQPSLFQFDSEGNPILPSLPAGMDSPQNCSLM